MGREEHKKGEVEGSAGGLPEVSKAIAISGTRELTNASSERLPIRSNTSNVEAVWSSLLVVIRTPTGMGLIRHEYGLARRATGVRGRASLLDPWQR